MVVCDSHLFGYSTVGKGFNTVGGSVDAAEGLMDIVWFSIGVAKGSVAATLGSTPGSEVDIVGTARARCCLVRSTWMDDVVIWKKT